MDPHSPEYDHLFRDQPDAKRVPADAAEAPTQSLGSEARDVDATRVDRPTSPPGGAAVPVIPAPGQARRPISTPPPTKSRPRKRHRVRRVVLWTLAVLLVYATALFAVFYSGVSTVAALPPDSTAASSGMNVLIVGSDSRADLSEEQQNELSTGSVEGNRTDTIMLLHVPLLGEPTLVSIPRDSWVPIPGYGSDKINSAFALGGPQLLVRTVEDVTGLQITDYIEVGFAGVAATTDAMGGVVLCPRQDFNDENSGLNVKAGCQTMDGPTALAYVRMRYADPRGDLGRVERQQEYVAAVAKRGMSPLTWLLPWRAFPAARAAGKALTVSNSTGIFDLGRIGIAMGAIGMGWGTSVTVPTEEEPLFVDGQDALKWKSAEALALFDSLR
ncbi:MAG: LytR family transcriptional regulator [Actinobacteria bacterium]|nr:MAG: LytR family transcriptional regulator [Actinomycetota bacterium]